MKCKNCNTRFSIMDIFRITRYHIITCKECNISYRLTKLGNNVLFFLIFFLAGIYVITIYDGNLLSLKYFIAIVAIVIVAQLIKAVILPAIIEKVE